MMRDNTADRGVSAVIGAVLVFGLLVAMLAVIQLGSVPVWNAGIEVEHSAQVGVEFQQFDTAVRRSVIEDAPTTAVVTLGASYPTRPFLYNPPPGTGRLSTTGAGELRVSNLDIQSEDRYPEATANEIVGQSRVVSYRPRYNEYTAAPITRYEHGVVYRQYDDYARHVSGGLITDDRITLLAVDGALNRTGTNPESVGIEPSSAPMRRVTVTNATAGPLVVRVPTRLSEGQWESRLAPEYASNGGYIQDDAAGVTVEEGTLTVELEPGVSYDLRMGAVSLGGRAAGFEPRYLSTPTDALLLRPLGGATLEARVYDRFNNPVSGEPVTFTADSGLLETRQVVTDESGRATVQYTAPEGEGPTEITATVDRNDDGDTDDHGEELTYFVTVVGSEDRTDDIAAVNPGAGAQRVRLVSATSSGPNATLTFDNDGPGEVRMAAVRVSYYFSDDTTPPPKTATFNYEGARQELSIPGEFAAVEGPRLTADGTADETTSVRIDDLKNNLKGDFMFVSVRYVDPTGEGQTTTYIVTIPE